jgi:SAM-dependent methyltransferase
MTRPAPEPAHPAEQEPHRLREVAESFGTDPERYDRTRPGYPEDLVRQILAGIPGRDVLDVGCGTGIAARQFHAAGCRVLGVEPDPRMAEVARRSGIPVQVVTFEDWDPEGRTFDAVIAATAWHWVDPVAGAEHAAEVLRPGGRLAPFWHAFQLPADLAAATADVCARVLPDAPASLDEALRRSALAAYQVLFDKAVTGIRASGAFSDPEQWRFGWERAYTRDEWLDQVPTQGIFTRLAPDALAQVLDSVGAAIDAAGGSFTMSYTTVAVTATRLPS